MSINPIVAEPAMGREKETSTSRLTGLGLNASSDNVGGAGMSIHSVGVVSLRPEALSSRR